MPNRRKSQKIGVDAARRSMFWMVATILPVLTAAWAGTPEAGPAQSPERLAIKVPVDSVGLSCSPPAKGTPTVHLHLKRTFYDDFSRFDAASQRWETHYEGDGRRRITRTHYDSPNERQIFVDP